MKVHSGVVRVTHWLNALAIIIMIGSGWRIYNSAALFDFSFPVAITLGGDIQASQHWHNETGLAGALQWHFAAMWLLMLNLIVYLVYGFASGHFRRAFLPLSVKAVLRDARDAVQGTLPHHIGHRNAVQKVLYIGVIALIILMVLSGLAIWKPVQFQELTALMGGYDTARYIHFFGMCGIVLFLVVHILLTVLVPKVLPPMITGYAREDAAPTTESGS